MKTRKIAKNSWGRFAVEFTAANLYRPAVVTVDYDDENRAKYGQALPFVGITVTKRGRTAEGLELSAKQYDPDGLAERLVSIKRPMKVLVEKDDTGIDTRLIVENDEGAITALEFTGGSGADYYRTVVERVAYNLYRQRGASPGQDLDDWLEAERKVRMAEFQFDR